MTLRRSNRLDGVVYDIVGPLTEVADELDRIGTHVLRLNVGDPSAHGFDPPDGLVPSVIRRLRQSEGYVESQGLRPAREAVCAHYEARGVQGLTPDAVWLGNGVSELLTISVQALLNDGDEILVPSPNYPAWAAAIHLAGGHPVPYVCDEQAGWLPDLTDLRRKLSSRSRAILIINPNNPTGAVYPRPLLEEVAEIARRSNLLLLSDEMSDRIVYDDATHETLASVAPDVPCITFGGLSKSYRSAGFRSGWLICSGPGIVNSDYVRGLSMLAALRLCANVPGQYAAEAALRMPSSLEHAAGDGGRLAAQRDAAWRALTAIDGVSCVKPQGSVYMFPRLDEKAYAVADDHQFALDLLRQEHVLITPGSSFGWAKPDHFRIVTLARTDQLEAAAARLERFLQHEFPRSHASGVGLATLS